jgi:hypothetical protein
MSIYGKIKKDIKYSYENYIHFCNYVLKVEMTYKSERGVVYYAEEKGCGEITFNLYQLPNRDTPMQLYTIEKCNLEELEKLFKEIVEKVGLIRFLEELEDYLNLLKQEVQSCKRK